MLCLTLTIAGTARTSYSGIAEDDDNYAIRKIIYSTANVLRPDFLDFNLRGFFFKQ